MLLSVAVPALFSVRPYSNCDPLLPAGIVIPPLAFVTPVPAALQAGTVARVEPVDHVNSPVMVSASIPH